ncbi:MAG: alpha/beta fold hydrolase [Mycobacteriaceae bacterium]|nr:alpha/beta fold hydrolase [Mycobacteriaceae bacterium]
MAQTLVISPPETERRIRLTHHLLELDDGHEVGVSIGGQGVPLVFMHGLALSRRAYLRMLSRVAGLGFLVIAVDAAGHGDTLNLPRDAGELADRVELTLRTLDALGIEQAVFAGHSMGGRMAIQLAAVAPHRVIAEVLFDAAAGASFDEAVPTLLHSPGKAMRTLLGMAVDTQRDPLRSGVAEGSRYLRMLASVALGNARHPGGFAGAARAIMQSGDYTPLLHLLRDNDIPTIVLHGEKDLIVPFDSARDIAEDADATLYCVPGAYHSWMIANPRHGADALRQLLDDDLGEALRETAKSLGIKDWRDTEAWDRALVDPDSWIRELNGARIEELGADEPEHLEMELVRRSQRPVHAPEPMPWVQRTYRRWANRRHIRRHIASTA